MAIITLTSDWGIKDHYAGAVKGAILKMLPSAVIVDISHQIDRFDIFQASFVLNNCFRNFPAGTVHIVDVLSESSPETPNIAVQYEDHYFVGTDNGLLTMIFDKPVQKIIEVDIIQDSDYFTFLARDLFAKVACHLASGNPIAELGKEKSGLKEVFSFEPTVEKNMIKGQVIYIDAYKNAFVNIKEALVKKISKGRKFKIYFRSPGYEITSISTSYSDVSESSYLALFVSNGYLEIAINHGNASDLLGLSLNEPVRIEFED